MSRRLQRDLRRLRAWFCRAMATLATVESAEERERILAELGRLAYVSAKSMLPSRCSTRRPMRPPNNIQLFGALTVRTLI
jgi:hypothetical protein